MAAGGYRNWRKEYEDLVAKLEGSGAEMRPVSRRVDPRFHVPAQSQQPGAAAPTEHPILDVSVGGTAFLSERSHPTASRLTISIGGEAGFLVDVVGANPQEPDANFPGYTHKVRSRFVNPEDGYRAFVVFWDLPQAD